MGRLLGVLVLAAVMAAFYNPIARAVDQTVLGKSFQVKNPQPAGDPSLRSVAVTGKEPLSDDTVVGDPFTNGATIDIIANGSNSTNQTFTLPSGAYVAGVSAGWIVRTSDTPGVISYTYKDPLGLAGPVKSAVVKKTKTGTFQVKATIKDISAPVPSRTSP